VILVDECRWPFRGRRWCHCVSDASLVELHRFVRLLGVPRRGFQGDHYDLPEAARAAAIDRGASAVDSRDLLARLRGAGLRLSPAARRAGDWQVAALRLDPADWLGRPVAVDVDRPLGTWHALSEGPAPVNVGAVSGTAGHDGLPFDAYVLGPDTPLTEVQATVVAVARRHGDVEDKLVAVTGGAWDRQGIEAAIAFAEHPFHTEVLVAG